MCLQIFVVIALFYVLKTSQDRMLSQKQINFSKFIPCTSVEKNKIDLSFSESPRYISKWENQDME